MDLVLRSDSWLGQRAADSALQECLGYRPKDTFNVIQTESVEYSYYIIHLFPLRQINQAISPQSCKSL